MNKKLYLENGFLNVPSIFKLSEKHKCPYIFIVGGRGTGKTYGVLKYTYENNIKIMYMRRTQAQHDIIRKNELSPYKSINADLDSSIHFFPVTKYNSEIYRSEIDEKGRIVPYGNCLGMTGALSTISNLRGFDAHDINVVVYDEFIPERHEKPLKAEAEALFNALETVGRNRELKNSEPLKLIALANANNMSNEIFIELKLVNVAEKMARTGQEIYFDHERGIMLIILNESPISYEKRATTLYRLTDNTDFSKMSVYNSFNGVVTDNITSINLREYKLLVVVGELAIYKHKSKPANKRFTYYITTHISGTPKETYTTSINSMTEFRFNHRDFLLDYWSNMFSFESYQLQVLFDKYLQR